MKKQHGFALAAALLSLASMPAQPDAGLDSLSTQVDAVFESLNRSDAPGCAVTVISEGRVVHERGYGMANLDYGVAITPDTVFYIASVSKQFTAAAIALLAEEGTISLEDDIRKYVPEIPAYQQPIRVRHLVHHTSGLRDYLGLLEDSGRSGADSVPEDYAISLIARQDALEFTPGSQYRYSNSGYFLLSVIVKRASGKSLGQYAQQKIFGPLGMNDTHFHDDRTRIVPNRATAYFRRSPKQGGGLAVYQTSYDLVGDGGLLTTVRDLVRWDQNFYHNVLGTRGAALIDQLQSTEPLSDGSPNNYAFGLELREVSGMKAIEHSGSFIGFRANYLRIPLANFSVIALCNAAESKPGKLSLDVVPIYLSSPAQREFK